MCNIFPLRILGETSKKLLALTPIAYDNDSVWPSVRDVHCAKTVQDNNNFNNNFLLDSEHKDIPTSYSIVRTVV